MRAWRLVRAVHRDAALTGYGARRFGGRWNSRGVACVYASETLEIALLEPLVQVDLSQLPRDLLALELEFPGAVIDALAEPPPDDWDAPPPYAPTVQPIGDRWLREDRALALRVPASVLPQRANLLLNPAHPDMNEVRIVAEMPLPFERNGRIDDRIGEGVTPSDGPVHAPVTPESRWETNPRPHKVTADAAFHRTPSASGRPRVGRGSILFASPSRPTYALAPDRYSCRGGGP